MCRATSSTYKYESSCIIPGAACSATAPVNEEVFNLYFMMRRSALPNYRRRVSPNSSNFVILDFQNTQSLQPLSSLHHSPPNLLFVGIILLVRNFVLRTVAVMLMVFQGALLHANRIQEALSLCPGPECK